MSTKNTWLLVAGIANLALTALHLVVIVVGADAYRFFGAGESMASKAEEGSLIPAAITLFVALVFALFALYAFSGAGLVRRAPLLRVALVVISFIFVLRGLSLFPQTAILLTGRGTFPLRFVVFSGASLIIGLVFALGTCQSWRNLARVASKAA